MRATLANLSNDFISNRNVVKSTLKWESEYMYPVCSAIITDKRKMVTAEQLNSCHETIKQKVGIFSDFRSYAKLAMIAMMAVDSNPSGKLDKALQVYGELKKEFWGSSYLPVAAMIIGDMVEEPEYDKIVKKTRGIYNMMKAEHPWLTSAEDSVLAALLALSEKDEKLLLEDMEECYKFLKPHFFSNNAVQSLSHVLALSDGESKTKCVKTMQIFDGLKAKGRKYGTSYELATLGVLAALPIDVETIVQDIIDVDDFLSAQKGYGILSVGKTMRLMHASMIVTSEYMEENSTMSATALSSVISLVVAEQAAMCAAIAATAAASSAN